MTGKEICKLMLSDHSMTTAIKPHFKPRNEYNSIENCIYLTHRTYFSHDPMSCALACHEAAHAILHRKKTFMILKAELEANLFAFKWLKSRNFSHLEIVRRVYRVSFLLYLVPRIAFITLIIFLSIWLA